MPTGGGGGCSPSRHRSGCIRTSSRAHRQHTTEVRQTGVVPARQAENRFLGSVKCLQILAQRYVSDQNYRTLFRLGQSCRTLYVLEIYTGEHGHELQDVDVILGRNNTTALEKFCANNFLVITHVLFEPKSRDTNTFLREKIKDSITFGHTLQDTWYGFRKKQHHSTS
jgi:hypothetical protein